MSSNAHPLGVIFDWDGVVIDSHDAHEAAWNQLAAELGRPVPEGFFKRIFGLRNREAIEQYTDWAAPADADRAATLARRKEELYRESLRRDGIEPTPGLSAFLDALDAAGIPAAVGSSAPRANIDAAMASLGLAERFVVITSAEDVAHGKPDPEVFLRCARAMERAPERCVVFEDAPAGLEAARRAGMKAVAVATTHPAASLSAADLVVATLEEVDVETTRKLFA